MSNENIMTECEYGSVRGSNSSANPGWWTIKRWSEFMWFAQRFVPAIKSAFSRLIAP